MAIERTLERDEIDRLVGLMQRIGWSWPTFAARSGIPFQYVKKLREGKLEFDVDFIEYMERVAGAIEAVPLPAPGVYSSAATDAAGPSHLLGLAPLRAPTAEHARQFMESEAAGNFQRQPSQQQETGTMSLAGLGELVEVLADLFVDAQREPAQMAVLQEAYDRVAQRMRIEEPVLEAIRQRSPRQQARQPSNVGLLAGALAPIPAGQREPF